MPLLTNSLVFFSINAQWYLKNAVGCSYLGQQLQDTRIHQILSKTKNFMQTGLAKSSKSTYSAGQRRYPHFCHGAKIKAIPRSKRALTLLITHLVVSNASHGPIKIYLSAVRHMHICRGLHKHFKQQLIPRLLLILRGVKKALSWRPSQEEVSPHHHSTAWQDQTSPVQTAFLHQHHSMCYVLSCLLRLLKISEFTIPTETSYKPSCHLSLWDIVVDSSTNPHYSSDSQNIPYQTRDKSLLRCNGHHYLPTWGNLGLFRKKK